MFWNSLLHTLSSVLISSLTTQTGQAAVTLRCVVGLLSYCVKNSLGVYNDRRLSSTQSHIKAAMVSIDQGMGDVGRLLAQQTDVCKTFVHQAISMVYGHLWRFGLA